MVAACAPSLGDVCDFYDVLAEKLMVTEEGPYCVVNSPTYTNEQGRLGKDKVVAIMKSHIELRS